MAALLARDEAPSFEATAHEALWRFDAARLGALRAAANGAGVRRAAGAADVECPRCLVGAEAPAADLASEGGAVSPGDETRLKAWFEAQIVVLCGRTAAADSRLRRSDKVSATAVVFFKRFFCSHSVLESAEPASFFSLLPRDHDI